MLHVWGGPSGSVNRGPQSLLLHYIYREQKREKNEKRMNKGFSFASRQVSLITLKAYWFTAKRFHSFSVTLFFHSHFSFQKSSSVPRAKKLHISTTLSSSCSALNPWAENECKLPPFYIVCPLHSPLAWSYLSGLTQNDGHQWAHQPHLPDLWLAHTAVPVKTIQRCCLKLSHECGYSDKTFLTACWERARRVFSQMAHSFTRAEAELLCLE